MSDSRSLTSGVARRYATALFTLCEEEKKVTSLQKDVEILSGLIFDPIKNEIFYAEKNQGAFFNNHRIRVSKKKDLDECLFATNYR